MGYIWITNSQHETVTTALKSNNAHVIAMELWEELIKVSNLFINI